MSTPEKGQRWVFLQQVEGQPAGDGVIRKVCAYCEEMMCVVN
ncbi:MAG: cupin domain-containing protein, partial [Provencibacterium sp.]|nr:cupin domain-containing protein [Provencibacterium sp.]